MFTNVAGGTFEMCATNGNHVCLSGNNVSINIYLADIMFGAMFGVCLVVTFS